MGTDSAQAVADLLLKILCKQHSCSLSAEYLATCGQDLVSLVLRMAPGDQVDLQHAIKVVEVIKSNVAHMDESRQRFIVWQFGIVGDDPDISYNRRRDVMKVTGLRKSAMHTYRKQFMFELAQLIVGAANN